MYLLICAVNSYFYDISMECKVYMNSSLPPYQYIMQSSVVILGMYSAFAGSGSLLLMRGFQIFAKRK